MGFPKGTEFVCDWCGSQFKLGYWRESKPKYCSTACTGKAQKTERVELQCEICGIVFEVPEGRSKGRRFCSKDCQYKSRENKVSLVCITCGDEFEVVESESYGRKNCSKKCNVKWQKKAFKGENNPAYRDVDIERITSLYEDRTPIWKIEQKHGVSSVTIYKRLREEDVDIRDKGYPKKYSTKKGDLVRSSYEKIVANFLYENSIPYEYEPDFPGKYIPDFQLDDNAVLEVWGIVNNPNYDSRKEIKKEWYDMHDVKCIDVYPSDLDGLAEVLNI